MIFGKFPALEEAFSSSRHICAYRTYFFTLPSSISVFVMLCYGGDMRALMLHALDLGMLNGDYAFLTVNLLPSAAIGNNTFMGNDGRDADAALAFRGILSIHVREPTTELWTEFKKEVREKMNDFPFYIKLDESEQVKATFIYEITQELIITDSLVLAMCTV